MRDLFFQIILFIAGALIGIAVPLFPKTGQKWTAGILAGLLISISFIWIGFEIGVRNTPIDENSTPTLSTNAVTPPIIVSSPSSEAASSPVVSGPLVAKGNVTIQDFGTESINLSREDVAIGTADRFQDRLQELEPPFTIFVIYGPIETDISLWWGGWDVWSNASDEHISNEINKKIDEIKENHPEDYKSRGYRVIKCREQISVCEIIDMYP